MYFVYILFSEKINRYYIGATHDVQNRVEQHNTGYYRGKWSEKGIPWTLFLSITCQNKEQALQIEAHIKRMKSPKYIENLNRYPELIQKLLAQYPIEDC